MNKQIKDKAYALNQWLLSQEVVKEYQKYEQLVHNNQELNQLEKDLKSLQQQIVNDKHQGIPCDSLIANYEKKKSQFDNHPLVYNYLLLKQEVNDLICQIQDDINFELKKMVD